METAREEPWSPPCTAPICHCASLIGCSDTRVPPGQAIASTPWAFAYAVPVPGRTVHSVSSHLVRHHIQGCPQNMYTLSQLIAQAMLLSLQPDQALNTGSSSRNAAGSLKRRWEYKQRYYSYSKCVQCVHALTAVTRFIFTPSFGFNGFEIMKPD